jgi:hypothetical protein
MDLEHQPELSAETATRLMRDLRNGSPAAKQELVRFNGAVSGRLSGVFMSLAVALLARGIAP